MTHAELRERRRLIAEAMRQGKTVGEAAHAFGVGLSTAYAAARETGVPGLCYATYEERRKRRQKIAEAVRDGASIGEAAKRFGVSCRMVENAAREHCYSRRQGRPPGITRSVWDVIDVLREDRTRADTDIAKQFGVTRGRIWQIRQQCIAHGLLEKARTP